MVCLYWCFAVLSQLIVRGKEKVFNVFCLLDLGKHVNRKKKQQGCVTTFTFYGDGIMPI